MLKVNKISEPDFFKEFKRKSKLKNWKDFDYKIKNELKEYMLENEQKFDGIYFCPYCEREINVEKSQIEHVKPKDKFPKLFHEYKNFLKSINTSKIKKEDLPDGEVVRFYGQIDENKFFVIGKLIYDMKSKTFRMVGSTQGKVLFDRISLFDRLDSVTYSDEIYF